jgi:hypothetical protein
MRASEILEDIAKSSTAAATSGSRQDIHLAMFGFENLAKLVHRGELRWEDLRPWAKS